MMVKKLEEELGVSLFDRNHQPITPTEVGIQLVEQAKKVLFETNRLQQIAHDSQETLKSTYASYWHYSYACPFGD